MNENDKMKRINTDSDRDVLQNMSTKSEETKSKRSKKVEKLKNSTMLGISFMVVLVLMVAVTVTWFVFSFQAGIKGNSLKVSDWDFIVSKVSGGEPINDGDTIDLQVDNFTNVTQGKMAPGTMGMFTIYVRTTSDVVTSCIISLDKSQLTLITDDSTDYSEILQKHLCFYSDKEMTKMITMEDSYVFDLVKGDEKKVTIYWKWPYEGDEIMPNNITDQTDINAFLKEYDDEDCLISDNRENIGGNIIINISGVSKEPETTTIGDLTNQEAP